MRRFAWLALLLALPTCSAGQIPRDGTTVAQTRVLPQLPKSAPTALGPIPIRRVPNLMCNGQPAFGCFYRGTWVIEIRDPLPLALAWLAVEHELFHADMQVAGIEFQDAHEEDKIADGAAHGRVLRMRAGWPR
jgi:hypothetical protein